ncbi:MAG: tetratricopeptide repeat protein [Pirellulaceae bacterium]
MSNLASVYQVNGDHAAAIALYEEAACGMEQKNFNSLNAEPIITNTINVYDIAGQYVQADSWREKWLTHIRNKSGKNSLEYSACLASFGQTLLLRQEWEQAEDMIRQCVTIRQEIQPDSWLTYNTKSMLGLALLQQKKYRDAEPLLIEGYQGIKKRADSIPETVRKTRMSEAVQRLIEIYVQMEKPDEVEYWENEAESLMQLDQ